MPLSALFIYSDAWYTFDSSNMRRLALGFIFLCLAVGVRSSHAQSPQLTTSATPWTSAEKLHIAGVPNAGKVTEQLYRGAQPRIPSLAQLKELGITTIVDLRAEDPWMRDQERKEAERLGIHFLSIPVGGWSNPTNDQIAQFLSLFGGHPDERVFVHCHFGEDRAGVFVASYRMAVQKWTAEQALREMYYFGFNGLWHRDMISFIRNFPARLTSVPALAAVSGSVSSPTSSVSTIVSPN
jgi:protein tyrosine/serine phosphatase